MHTSHEFTSKIDNINYVIFKAKIFLWTSLIDRVCFYNISTLRNVRTYGRLKLYIPEKWVNLWVHSNQIACVITFRFIAWGWILFSICFVIQYLKAC